MQASVISREFTWSGVKIPDPGRHLSPEEVRAVLATMYPDIATATITGPEAVGEKLRLSFRRRNRNPGCICFFLPTGLSSLFPLKSASSRDPPAIGGVGIFFWNFVCGRRVCAFKVG